MTGTAKPTAVRLTDATFRDGNRSLLGGRLGAEEILALAPRMDRVGFAAIDAFGGGLFERWLRLGEDPWRYLRRLRQTITGTPILALVRGQSLLGPRHLADDAVELFFRTAANLGVDGFRIFDPLNDPRNLEAPVRVARGTGRRVQVGLCWAPGPGTEAVDVPGLARALAELGADELVLKDSSGALDAPTAAALVAQIRAATGLPVTLHTHCTGGMGMLACAAAVEAGVEGLDTAVSALAWGASLPAAESVAAALARLGRDPGIDLDQLAELREELRALRRRHRESECQGLADFGADALRWNVPAAVVVAVREQLGQHGAGERLEAAMAEVARVVQELGRPPLLGPTSRMVATQAVYNVLGGERYTTVTQELKEYLQGLQGRPPAPVDAEVRRFVLGQDEPVRVRPADLLEPQVEGAREQLQGRGLPVGDEQVVTHLMFPAEAAALFAAAAATADGASAPAGEEDTAEAAAVETPEVAPAEAAEQPAGAGAEPPTLQAAEFEVEVEGEVFRVRVTGAGVTPLPAVSAPARPREGAAEAAPRAQAAAPRDGTVVAPMQGLIVKIPIAVGDQVQLGDVLVVLEAMKMQNDIVATKPGRVTGIYVREGEVVKPDQALVAVG